MALFADAFDALASLQQTLDSFRASSWLTTGPSGGGGYPPMNVFRKGDDFILITEVPGIQKVRPDGRGKGQHYSSGRHQGGESSGEGQFAPS